MPLTIEAHIHHSPPAVKIGEFDAEAVQQALDDYTPVHPLDIYAGELYELPQDISQIFRTSLQLSGDHAQLWTPEQFDSFFYEPNMSMDPDSEPYRWHIDTCTDVACESDSDDIFAFAAVGLGATAVNTETLRGVVQIPTITRRYSYSPNGVLADFFTKEEGAAVVDDAIERGDLVPPEKSFESGEIILLPEGAIHRRPTLALPKRRAHFKALARNEDLV